MKLLKRFVMRIRGQAATEDLIKRGLQVGSHFSRRNDDFIDASHAYMIRIGNHVTLAGNVTILAHDASMNMYLGYTRIAPVVIGDYVFLGQNSTVLPGVTIGNRVIVGAGSVVTKDVADGCIVAGNPARVIGSTDAYIEKHRERLNRLPKFDSSYTGKNLNAEKISELREKTANEGGYIV